MLDLVSTRVILPCFFLRYLNDNKLNTITESIFGGASAVSNDFVLDNNNMTYIYVNALKNSTIGDFFLQNNLFKFVPQVVSMQSFDEL